jgi:hypothetical protein
MLKVIPEQEHYLLISDGQRFTVVERRAGKFYPLCTGVRHGLDLGDETIIHKPVWFVLRARCTTPSS